MRTEVDQYLSSLYPKTIEKVAQNQRFQNLNKMAQQEGLNLNGLTPEQLELLAQEQLNAISNVEEPQADPQAAVIKEAQANLELADYMGRIMAHAFHQESGFIYKEAADQMMTAQQSQQAQQGGQASQLQDGAFDQLVLQYAAQIVQQQGGDISPLQNYVQQAQAVEQQQAQYAQQAQAQQYQQQLAQQQQAQYQQQLQAQQAQRQQQAAQQRPQGLPQQSPTAQMMGQQGQQYGQAAQGGVAQRPGQQRQVGYQPQQQAQGQFQQEQIQGQSAEAVKMASEVVQAQFNEALENAAWKLLEQAGYQIDDGQQPQQQMQQMGQQQQMGGQPQQQQFQQPIQ